MSESSQPRKLRIPTTGGRLILVSPLVSQHDALVKELYEQPSTRRFIRALPSVWPVETIRAERLKRAANPTQIDFAIHFAPSDLSFLKDDDDNIIERLGAFVGVCNLNITPSNSSAQAGIFVSGNHQGQHLATEALHALLSLGFSKDGGKLHRIVFETAEDNTQMRGWLENTLGVNLEYTQREAYRDKDGWLNSVGYSVLESEWEGQGGLEAKLKQNLQAKVAGLKDKSAAGDVKEAS